MTKATLIQGKSLDTLTNKIENFYKKGNKASIAVVISNLDVNVKRLGQYLSKNNCEVFGCVRFNNLYPHYTSDSSKRNTLIFMLDMPKSDFKIRQFTARNKSDYALGLEIGASTNVTYQNPGVILLGSGLSLNHVEIQEGIKHTNDMNFHSIFEKEAVNYQNAFVFNGNCLCEYGILALIYDEDKIDLSPIPHVALGEFSDNVVLNKGQFKTDSNFVLNSYKNQVAYN